MTSLRSSSFGEARSTRSRVRLGRGRACLAVAARLRRRVFTTAAAVMIGGGSSVLACPVCFGAAETSISTGGFGETFPANPLKASSANGRDPTIARAAGPSCCVPADMASWSFSMFIPPSSQRTHKSKSQASQASLASIYRGKYAWNPEIPGKSPVLGRFVTRRRGRWGRGKRLFRPALNFSQKYGFAGPGNLARPMRY